MERTDRNTQYFLQLLCVVNLLRRAAVDFHQQSKIDTPGGMTAQQISVLAFLCFSREEDIYQKDLENFFHLRRSTVSSLLTTLEKKGVLRRESVSHDARLKKIVVTESGRHIGQEVQKQLQYAGNILMEGITDKEAAALGTALQKMQDNLRRLDT